VAPSTAPQGASSQLQDTSASAKPGGIYQWFSAAEIDSLDALPAPSVNTARTASGYVYSRLLKFKPGVLAPPLGEIEGDLAESWEIAPDGLQVTLKLRPEAKFDPRAPTNGRAVDAQDVLFSWKKFSETSSFRGDLFNGASAASPILSMSAPDARTVVVKLAFPDALTLPLLASAGHLYIQPKEADGGFDPKQDARGSGPWLIESLRRSVGVEFKKNPNWYRKDRPFFDGVSMPIVPEYAQQLAQFRAGNIWQGAVRQEDILSTRKDHPSLIMYSAGTFSQGPNRIIFGVERADSPFRDERVRRAYSLAMDRDLIIDTFADVSSFEKAGVKKGVRWNTAIPAGWDGAWLDPRGSDFGPNGKNYEYNVAEAKKLLTAAGHPNGFEYDLHYSVNGFSPTYVRQAEIMAGNIEQAGMRAKLLPEDHQTLFLPKRMRDRGLFTGVSIIASSAAVDSLAMISAYYHSTGGMSTHQPPFEPDPETDRMIEAMRREFDMTKRFKMTQDFQRSMAGKLRLLLWPGDATTFTLAWPWVGNAGVFNAYGTYGAPAESLIHQWFDQSKKKS